MFQINWRSLSKVLILLHLVEFSATYADVSTQVEADRDRLVSDALHIGALLGNVEMTRLELERWLPKRVTCRKHTFSQVLEKLVERKYLRIHKKDKDITYSFQLSDEHRKGLLADQLVMNRLRDPFLNSLSIIFTKDWDSLIQYVGDHPSVVPILENFLSSYQRQFANPVTLLEIQIHLLEYYMYAVRNHQKALALMDQIDNASLFHQLEPHFKALFISNKANLVSTHYASDKKRMQEVDASMESAYLVFMDNNNLNEALRILSCWAQIHIIRGDMEKAIKLLQQGEGFVANTGMYRYRAIFYYVSAWCYIESGNYKKCLYNIKQAIKYQERSVPTPLLFFSYNMRAEVELLIGNVREAYSAAKVSYAAAKKYDATRSADWKAEAMVVLSKCALKLGNYRKAQEYIDQADQDYRSFFKGPDVHIDQAAIPQIKGNIAFAQGLYDKAVPLYLESLDMYSQILGDKPWFDGLGRLQESLMLAWIKLGKQGKALEVYRHHRKLFGESHPRSGRMRKELKTL